MAYLDVISLADAKLYLRVDDSLTEDDTQITSMINTALKYVEDYTQVFVYSREKTYRLINGYAKVYDYPINSVIVPLAETSASGTAQCTSVIATDTIVVNGLTYTAVSGDIADYTEFSIGTDTVCAANLARSVNGDTRTGTLGSVTATSSGDTVTFTSSKDGFDGNATTLAETGGTITLSGSTFTGGLDGGMEVTKYSLYTDYCYGTKNANLILNIGYSDCNDVPSDLIDVAEEIIDILYYGKETGKTMADISPMSLDILNQSKRFVF